MRRYGTRDMEPASRGLSDADAFGGSLARVVRAGCLLRETGERALEIAQLIADEKKYLDDGSSNQ